MRHERVRFALAGLGMGGETHARELQALPDAELVAVYGRDAAKAERFATKFGVKRWYADYRHLLEDREVDVVNVLTPNGLHRDFAVAAAEAGKHVVVEKPLEITLDRADDIIRTCRARGVKLAVILQMRFGDAARKIKQAVDSGAFGRLLIGDVYDKEYRAPSYYAGDYWRGTREYEGGGALMTQSIHVVDLLQWIMGPVRSVFGRTRTALHDIAVEDLAVASVVFENGAIGVIESATCAYPALKARIEVHGEHGTAIFNGEHDELIFWELRTSAERIDTPPGFRLKDVSDPRSMPEERHRRQLQDVINAIREDRDPAVTGEEARKSLAIVRAIYDSAATRREVLLTS